MPQLTNDENNKLKVLYVIDTLQTGGAEKSILDIASKIRSFKPIVCHIYKNDFLKGEFERCGIRVISLNIEGPYNFLKGYMAFRKVLRDERPALVISTLLRSELISRIACKAEHVINIGTFVNDTYSTYELHAVSLAMKLKICFFWIFNMLTARFCFRFLSNSESIKNSNCRALLLSKSKVEVIYRGRDPHIFQFSRPRFDENGIRFLSVGRLLFRKGHEELVKAFALLYDKSPGSSLTIAGEGPYRHHLQHLIKELNLERSVSLLGNVMNIADLMQRHDVFVFPSHYEGFSGTLVEAMFSGIPIIASDIPMNKEALDESTARFFPVKDVDALAGQMVWVLERKSHAMQLAANARRVAEARFTIDVIASQHERYYKALLERLRY